ncbi:MAG: hypothetical protein LBE79_08105 [Tannerella sp.]|nr:hypothetical protein [Tannerella sp.]
MITKNIKRKIRVFRLLAIVQAYHHYTMMQLNRQLLQHDNSWQHAEHLSHWMNVLMPYKESSPTDFLHDKDEVSDKVLDNYGEYKKWISIAEKSGITEKTLTAFCKNVDSLQSVFWLKAFGHIFYPDWLAALFLYVNNAISKTELQNTFVEYSLFSGKAKPANLAEFRKTILDIEKTISQIACKQICRGVKYRNRGDLMFIQGIK